MLLSTASLEMDAFTVTIIYYRILDGIERDQRHGIGYGKIFDKESTKPNQKKRKLYRASFKCIKPIIF